MISMPILDGKKPMKLGLFRGQTTSGFGDQSVPPRNQLVGLNLPNATGGEGYLEDHSHLGFQWFITMVS